jgi:hypothetical protein
MKAKILAGFTVRSPTPLDDSGIIRRLGESDQWSFLSVCDSRVETFYGIRNGNLNRFVDSVQGRNFAGAQLVDGLHNGQFTDATPWRRMALFSSVSAVL